MQCEAVKFSNKKGRIRCPSCNGLNPLDLPINKTSGKSFNCFSCGTLLYAFKFKSNLLIIPHRGWVSRSRRGFRCYAKDGRVFNVPPIQDKS